MDCRIGKYGWLLGLVSLSGLSCGSDAPPAEVYTVRGQVLYQGQPAPLAEVVFHPVDGPDEIKKLRPRGQADDGGRFQLSTFRRRDGAPAGQYKVTIVWRGPDPGTSFENLNVDDFVGQEDRLAGKYEDPVKTPLEATVAPGDNQLEPFRVE